VEEEQITPGETGMTYSYACYSGILYQNLKTFLYHCLSKMKWRLSYVLLFGLLLSCHRPFHYLPASPEDLHVIHYSEFSLSYNVNHRQPNWVAYELTAEELKKDIVRKNYFSEDSKFGARSARLADYQYSGYDRGHLCRAEYCKSDEKAYRQSFLLSNMSPQIGVGFNRAGGAWYNLEELEVKLATDYGKLYSVSGPVFHDQLGTIGENKITIPGYFFKAFLLPDYSAAIGFIVRHTITAEHVFAFAVTIDSLESFTNIDFYPSLPDDIEGSVESTLDLAFWVRAVTPGNKERPASGSSEQPLVECKGITKTFGKRCARLTQSESGYCWQHIMETHEDPDLQSNPTCRATTKSGAPCKRLVNDSDYCWQHGE
jgi:endonuclease G